MLPRLNSMVFGGGFTEMKKLPDLPSKFRQILILIQREVLLAHINIVSRYIVRIH